MSFDITTQTEKFKQINEAHEAYLKTIHDELKSEARKSIVSITGEFFRRNPDVHAIRWTQYTPYFNDGEACSFSIGDVHLQITDTLSDDEETYFDGHEGLISMRDYYLEVIAEAEAAAKNPTPVAQDKWSYRQNDPAEELKENRERLLEFEATIARLGGAEAVEKIVSDFTTVSEFISSIKADYLELLFGDHVEVSVTKSDITVEEYDHS